MSKKKLRITIKLETPRDESELDLRAMAAHFKTTFSWFNRNNNHTISMKYDEIEAAKKPKKRGKK